MQLSPRALDNAAAFIRARDNSLCFPSQHWKIELSPWFCRKLRGLSFIQQQGTTNTRRSCFHTHPAPPHPPRGPPLISAWPLMALLPKLKKKNPMPHVREPGANNPCGFFFISTPPNPPKHPLMNHSWLLQPKDKNLLGAVEPTGTRRLQPRAGSRRVRYAEQPD